MCLSAGTAQQEEEKVMTVLVTAGLGKGDRTPKVGLIEAALRKRKKSNGSRRRCGPRVSWEVTGTGYLAHRFFHDGLLEGTGTFSVSIPLNCLHDGTILGTLNSTDSLPATPQSKSEPRTAKSESPGVGPTGRCVKVPC